MAPRTPKVLDGKIQRLSVSSIDTFDDSTTFGCQRKWWFQEVLGLETPQNASASLGDTVHKSIEGYLLTGVNGLHPVALRGKNIIDHVKPRVVAVERWFDGTLTARGIPLRGKVDVTMAPAPTDPYHVILDWKTTSNIQRYAKGMTEMRNSTQLLGYSQEFFNTHPDESGPVRNTLVYFQTKGAGEPKVVSSLLDKDFVREGWTKLEDKVITVMERVAAAKNVEDVTPNRCACDIAQGCPFRSRCPGYSTSDEGSTEIMSLLERFKKPATETAPATEKFEPVPPPRDTTPDPAPTAPAEPEKSAAAPPPPSPPPVAKRRGRPPKAQAQPSASEFQHPPSVPCAGPCDKSTAPTTQRVTKVTVRHGLTINLDNYQFAKVEIELEAEGSDVDSLTAKVREALEKEAAVYLKKEVV